MSEKQKIIEHVSDEPIFLPEEPGEINDQKTAALKASLRDAQSHVEKLSSRLKFLGDTTSRAGGLKYRKLIIWLSIGL